MKFLKEDTVVTLLLALVLAVVLPAVVVGQGSVSGKVNSGAAAPLEMESSKQGFLNERQKGVGGTGKGEGSAEAVQPQARKLVP